MNKMVEFARAENAAAKRHWNMGDELRKVGAKRHTETAQNVLSQIVADISAEGGVSVKAIMSRSKRQPFARYRMYAYLVAERAGVNRNEIAYFFDRDLSTISHGISEIRRRLEAAE